MTDNIYMTSTSVGSGKTTIAIDWMLQFEQFQYWIYVAPTIRLLQETQDRLNDALLTQMQQSGRALGVAESFHSDQGPFVAQRVLDKIENELLPNSILLITTDTFMNILSRIKTKPAFGVILDEAFKAYDKEQFQSNENVHLLTDLFDENLEPMDSERVNLIANKQFDIVGDEYDNDKIVNICDFINNPALETRTISKTDNFFQIGYYVKPKQFQEFGEIILMAANFEQSILYHVWTKLGIEFKAHPFFTDDKLTNVHQEKGALVDIFYLLHPDDYSSLNNLRRNFLTGEVDEKEKHMTVAHYLLNTVSLFLSKLKQDYLLTINSSFEQMKVDIGKAEKIPTRAHGLNKYSQFNNCVTLAITNANPTTEVPYLKEITGMNDSGIHTALRLDTFYQALGRTSIRDRNNNDRKIFIVPSKADAEYLHVLFEGSRLYGQLGNLSSLSKAKGHVRKANLKDSEKGKKLTKKIKSAQRQKNRLEEKEQDTVEIEKNIALYKAQKEELKASFKLDSEDKKEGLMTGMMPRGLNANNYPVRNRLLESIEKNVANYLESIGA